jgi:hypothetical protein
MKILVQRFHSTKNYTAGLMYIDGEFVCFTLEDEKRDVKVYAETRIPSGIYTLSLQTSGSLHTRYKAKFSFHKGMLLLNSVPNFSGIMIHIGNTDKDTAGCLLVGHTFCLGCSKITDSQKAYEKIYPRISAALLNDETVNVHVVDEMITS